MLRVGRVTIVALIWGILAVNFAGGLIQTACVRGCAACWEASKEWAAADFTVSTASIWPWAIEASAWR
jgi:hypothetical protein